MFYCSYKQPAEAWDMPGRHPQDERLDPVRHQWRGYQGKIKKYGADDTESVSNMKMDNIIIQFSREFCRKWNKGDMVTYTAGTHRCVAYVGGHIQQFIVQDVASWVPKVSKLCEGSAEILEDHEQHNNAEGLLHSMIGFDLIMMRVYT